MAREPMPTRLQTAGDLHHLVDRTRHCLLRNSFIVATCGVLIIALLWLLAACLVDQWRPLSDGWRIVAFLLGISLLAVAIGFAARSFMRRPSLHQVAMRIEATQPAMHNRLITVLDLHQQKQAGGDAPHEAFMSDLIAQTCQRMGSYRSEQVADGRQMRRAIGAYAIVLIITAVCAAALGQRWFVSMARLLQPLASIAPMTAVEIAALSGDVEALQGEAVTLIGCTQRGSIESMAIELRANKPDGRWHRYPMSASNVGVFTFDLAALDQSYDYRLIGGSTWTQPHRIAMLERPAISAMQARLFLPAYMGLPQPIPISDLTRIAAPIGATLEFSASITGSAATAHLNESPLQTTTTPPVTSTDRLWIDDALPADAQILGQWRWTDEHAHSGHRSHTFSASRLPYGFRSRLSPLVITADSPFFIHVRLDPPRLPSSLSVSLGDEATRHDLTWGSGPTTAIVPESTPYLGKPRTQYMGPLPAVAAGSPAQWVRLEVSLAQLLGPNPARTMSITSLMLHAQGGEVHFDSIGSGSLSRSTPTKAPLPIATHEMKQQGGNHWITRVQVQRDSQLVAEVRNAAGRAAPALTPMTVLAKVDQPPVVVMERAMRVVTLSGVQPVPLSVQVFDDFGLSAAGYQVARDPEMLGDDANWIDVMPSPVTSHRLLALVQPVDGQGQPFKEGEAMYLRAAARDRKGQVAFGETIRFSFMKPSDTPEPSPQQRDDALAKLLAELSSLAGKQEQLVQQMEQNLRSLPEMLKRELPLDEQGRAIPQAEMDRLLRDWFGQQNDSAQGVLRSLDASATEHRESAARLAQQLEEQARSAGRSPLALPLEQEVLGQLAAKLREAWQEKTKEPSADSAMLDRLRNMDRLTAAQQAALAQAMQHLQTLQKAREQGSADPRQAATSLENLLTQLQAEGATRELQELTQALIQKQQRLAALHEQQLKLQRDAAARAKPPDESIEKQRAKLDEEMQAALNQSRQLLGQPAQKKPEHADAKQRDAASLQEQRDHRLAQLTLDRQSLASSREQAMQLAESLRTTAAKLSAEASHDATATRDQVQSLMTSTTMKSLMRMAGRARMQAMEDRQQPQFAGDRVTPDNPGQTTGEQNQPQVKRGDIMLPAAVRDAEVDPSLAPALYRLPPHLRSALLQGMKEKGPQGYQSLIDGYHRHLAESVRLEP